MGTTDIIHVDSMDKIPLLFKSLRARKCKKVLYIMTSNMPVSSNKYRKMIQNLKNLKQSDLEIAIISDDLVCRQLGLVRNKQLKRWESPEARLVYLDKFVSTTEKETIEVEGKQVERYKIAEKGNIEHDYWLKYSYSNAFDFTQEKLQEFLDKGEAGQLEHYYENTQDYTKYTIRVDSQTFKTEVLENKKITVLEIFGKYCPGCRAIKKDVEKIAKQLKDQLGVQIYRVCCDTDYIPELRGMKPFTPAFWVFQNEKKPVLFNGKIEQLYQFVEVMTQKEEKSQ